MFAASLLACLRPQLFVFCVYTAGVLLDQSFDRCLIQGEELVFPIITVQ